MHTLGAIVPDGLGVVDEDGEDRGGDTGGGLEAGEDAFDGGHDVVDGDAGVGEGGLDDGVVLAGRLAGRRGSSSNGSGLPLGGTGTARASRQQR